MKRTLAFGSLHDGSHFGIGKDATTEVVWVDLLPSENQTVPGWSVFNAVVHSCVPLLTNIGYCPMIDGSTTEFRPRSAIMDCTFFLNVYIVLNYVGEPSISKKMTSVVEMFDGNTTPNISLLAMISFAMLVSIIMSHHHRSYMVPFY